ncbi:substrate-binding domain-containing protein [Notoacmeibacter sp. MSK16QG-6]|uniref:substrate-binding domain-containing protein n=1 Tax=Notoacmeibacter sp. MSK16QG-6 TaxID=2957982 RepID=UPI00209E2AAD|nr:substrate-binding domain-containing protein [Notoacmeibacter sp. MSK16QG-6]MCP1200649.1 substrate-binding domain-containing protein [Notoacmeibacter sp. MSK16QG-6]
MPFVKLKTPASAARFRRTAALAFAALVISAAPAASQTSDLTSKTAFRVCADPASMPLSNDKGEGFENKIAELFAEQLSLPLEYTWFPMATGFIRRTLQANKCDVVIGYGQGDEMVQNTNHYYTSAYVLIVAADGSLAEVSTLSDPALKDARIGIIAGSPPATQMVRNRLMAKARPYDLMVDRRYQNPADDMLKDLQSGEIDAAILWGPIGGPMVKEGYPDFKVTPLLSEATLPRMFYRITMGVRRGEKVWERKLNSLIRRNQDAIDKILFDAGVPLLDQMGTVLLDKPK